MKVRYKQIQQNFISSNVQNNDLDYSHPPNCPNLSPCDFWLFDLIKRNLSDHNDAQSLHDAITEFMYSLYKEEYRKAFDKWIERMQLCVDNQGHYFEHLMK